jgi:hypothetical protein
MGREELPSFDEALDRFGAFLMAREWPDTVGWVLGEDLAWAEGVLLIRPGARQTREALVRSLFERGRDHAFGVELRAIAECRGETLATLVVPTEPRPEARDTHASGKLKLVVPPNGARPRRPLGRDARRRVGDPQPRLARRGPVHGGRRGLRSGPRVGVPALRPARTMLDAPAARRSPRPPG